MNVIPYKNLSIEALKEIAKLKLSVIEKQLKEKNITFTYSDALLKQIVALSNAVETGARNLELIINSNLMPKLSKVLLENMVKEKELKSITVSIKSEDGDIIIEAK